MAVAMSGQDFYRTNEGYAAMLATHGEAHFAVYLDKIGAHIPAGATLLDLGCGTGRSSRLLADRGFRVTGSDLSEKFLDRTLESKGLTLVAADAMALPFPDQTFDAVASYCFIEHVPDVPKVLDEMIRVTKPGGRILVLSPNLLSPFLVLKSALARLRGREIAGVFPRSIPFHAVLFVRHLLILLAKRISRRAGFLYRTPDHTRPTVADADATWWCTQLDLLRHLQARGCAARLAGTGYSPGGRIAAAIFPALAGECCVIATTPADSSNRR